MKEIVIWNVGVVRSLYCKIRMGLKSDVLWTMRR